MKSNFLSSTAEIARPTRRLTILAQDPSLRDRRKNVITAAIDVPNEQLSAGPRGYRVQVVDYDSSTNKMYVALDAAKYGSVDDPADPFARTPSAKLLTDPRFHAQNAYAIAMRTLAQFERALGRRVSWSFGGHQTEDRSARLRRGQRVLLGRRGSAVVWLFRGRRISVHVPVA